MRWSDIPRNPDRRTLRQFAALWTLFFALLACWHGFVGGRPELALMLAVLAGTVGPLGMIWPRLIRPIFIGAALATFPIGWLVSRVVLTCLYYGVFTPLALLFRLRGRDALELRRPQRASYWAPKEMPAEASSYFRQY